MKLIFVYNAHSGRFNAYLDSLHKVLSPASYSCKLCKLTHGVFSERTLWKAFRENSNLEMEFLHKDEFFTKHISSEYKKLEFPVVLREENGQVELLLTRSDFDRLETEKDLIAAIAQKTKPQ
ncbi:GTPase [Leeuwenhoekiella marinoflava]|uniref:GTPase n=1 Tax=Leeuwenhoekiella marinoflava TaxID=988 RepID=UPI003002B454